MTSPQRPRPTRPVEYKGEPLDAARGPGLGCFWLQAVVLAALVVLTPLTVAWGWPPTVSEILLFVVILLLLLTGQTVIFLLRLVAAGRTEGRRRPLASPSLTVGELEDADDDAASPGRAADAPPGRAADAPPGRAADDSSPARATPGDGAPGVQQ